MSKMNPKVNGKRIPPHGTHYAANTLTLLHFQHPKLNYSEDAFDCCVLLLLQSPSNIEITLARIRSDYAK